MAETTVESNDPDLALADLLEQLTHRVRQGEVLDLEKIRVEFPEHAQRLHEMLPVLEFLIDLSECGVDPRGHPADRVETMPAVVSRDRRGMLGDFRIVREIGCGGMGVVYEAEQISLGRRVALKVLPFATMLDPRQVLRFQNESRAAASLDHANIVKVYSVGSDRGVHYYAMQYIEGRTLAALIAELRQPAGIDPEGGGRQPPMGERPSEGVLLDFDRLAEVQWPTRTMGGERAESLAPRSAPAADAMLASTQQQISTVNRQSKRSHFRSIARLGIQAAEALEHAHQMGIVHRDIKPANLLIDSTGHLWVTDFGLARSQADGNLTITGDVLGTPRYMSPEQLAGDRRVLDHRTDIYSLGASLYELITLNPAFAEPDRNRLVSQVAEQEPPAMRRFDRSVPRELETIVLKAMAKDPSHRYRSAQELAEDLQRFVDDRPILAQRPTTMARIVKWSRRNRPVVLPATTIVLLAAILGPVAAISQMRLRQTAEIHAKGEAVARLEAVNERNRAEVNLAMAIQAVDEMYTQLAERHVTEMPKVEQLRLDFLKRAVRFYGDFAEANRDNRPLRQEVAMAYLRQGRAHAWLGQHEEAEAAYRGAYHLLKQVAARQPQIAKLHYQLACCADDLGFLLRGCNRYAEAESFHLEAIQTLERYIAEHSDHPPDYVILAAHAENNLGLCYKNEGRLSEAEECFRKSLRMKEEVVADHPANSEYRYRLSFSLHDLAGVLQEQGKIEEAKLYYRRAIDEKESLTTDNTKTPDFALQLALSYNGYGYLLRDDGPDESVDLYRKSFAILQRLIDEYPGVPVYLLNYTQCSYNLALGHHRKGDIREAEGLYRQSIAASERYLQSNVFSAVSCRSTIGAALHNLAVIEIDRGELTEARALLIRAVDAQETVLRERGESDQARKHLRNHYDSLSKVLVQLGEYEEAAAIAEKLAQARGDEADDDRETGSTVGAVH